MARLKLKMGDKVKMKKSTGRVSKVGVVTVVGSGNHHGITWEGGNFTWAKNEDLILVESKEASLRSKLIRLASSKPELRPHLLPILAGVKKR